MGLLRWVRRRLSSLPDFVDLEDDEADLWATVRGWVGAPKAFPREVTSNDIDALKQLASRWERRGLVSETRDLLADGIEVAFRTFHPASLVRLAVWHAHLTAKVEGLAEAERVLQEFEQRVRRAATPDIDVVGALQVSRGQLRLWAGDFEGALLAWGCDDAAEPVARHDREPYREPYPNRPAPPLATALLAARVLTDMERFETAREHLERIAARGDCDEGVLQTYWGTLERERGEHSAAMNHYKRAQRAMDQRRIPAGANVRMVLAHARARLLMTTEDWERAESLALDALLACSKRSGDDDPYLASILPDLSRIWHATARKDEAARATARGMALAELWRAAALVRADAEYASALVRWPDDRGVALENLASADARLHALPQDHARRVRITRLRSEIEGHPP